MLLSLVCQSGDEVLIDYGYGTPLSNERLLLEYGFVLPSPAELPDDTLELPFGAIAVGLGAVEAAEAAEAAGVAAEDDEALAVRQQTLLGQLGDVEAAGLTFTADGEPSDATLALAMVLTARSLAELPHPTTEALLVDARQDAESASDKVRPQRRLVARARLALRAVAAEALMQVDAALPTETTTEDYDAEEADFEAVAVAFCRSRRDILARASVAREADVQL